VVAAIELDKLKETMAGCEYLQKVLGAVRIQYLLDDNDGWKLNFVLTATGGVIGSEAAYDRRTAKMELMNSKTSSAGPPAPSIRPGCPAP